jgi:AcrR family transcriptional regulator
VVRAGRRPRVRAPLTRERVLAAAVRIADEHGLEAVTMRRLGQELGVEAMSLYNHVANKDDILNAIVDLVEGEIELPGPDEPWKSALRKTATSYHDALGRHPWAASLALTSTGYRASRYRYMDAVLGTMRRAGFSSRLTELAYHALDSHISGFTLWAGQLQIDTEDLNDLATAFLAELPQGAFPYLVEHVHDHMSPHDPETPSTFAFGLDLLLDGFERALATKL